MSNDDGYKDSYERGEEEGRNLGDMLRQALDDSAARSDRFMAIIGQMGEDISAIREMLRDAFCKGDGAFWTREYNPKE